MDQAVWFFGSHIDSEVEKAGQKRQKGEAQIMSARKRVLSKFVDDASETKGKFADPAALFETG